MREMRRNLLMMAALTVCTFGCNLPGIPLFTTIDSSDAQVAPDSGSGTEVCKPGGRTCIGNSVRICSADGASFAIEACGVGETCDIDTCRAIPNTCAGTERFALSQSELAFDVTDDLKAQTKQLRLENCSAAPFVLRDASVRGPERPDGAAVFALTTPVTQSSVPAGGSVILKIQYRPTQGLTHVVGRLELSLVLGELTNVEIPLRSKAICAAASPRIDFGYVTTGSYLEGAGILQNCGTEELRLERLEAPPTLDVELSEKIPYSLEPGEQIAYGVRARPQNPGFFSGTISFSFEGHQLTPMTRVDGLAGEAGCTDVTLTSPQLLANDELRPPAPGDEVRIRYPDADVRLFHWTQLIDQPSFSFERFERTSDGFTIRPRVIGTYQASVTGFDVTSGLPSCDVSTFTFDLDAPDGLYVELAWFNDGDAIPSDVGFGNGINLDLHVVSTLDGEGTWNEERDDCFPGVLGPCGAAGGTISASQSGGIPEFVHFADPDPYTFEVGVYLSNPFNFPGGRARVRVYRDDELVTELTSGLQSANDFWLVGRWDLASGWTDIDRTFSGFPK